MTDDPAGEPIGSLAEEASKLFDALSQGVKGHNDAGHRAPECEWCPLCRGVRGLLELNPEVAEHLVIAASSLARAATAFLATDIDAADTER